MESIGVLLFEPCFYSAGFDPRLRLGCTQKLLISTEACSTARVVVIIREGLKNPLSRQASCSGYRPASG